MTLDRENFLTKRLAHRREQQLFRALQQQGHLTDFASNDYLGFARSADMKMRLLQKLASHGDSLLGSTGSRLISGNTYAAEKLESWIAHYHGAEAGLLFNSGYDANLGLFAAIASKGDTLITDELVHASIIDGARLSYAQRFRFRHNDVDDLERQLKKASGNIFIGVESVYSMDGDVAPLKEIAVLAEQYQAHLLVDEAHATGVFGEKGRGLVSACGLEDQVLARVHTFGKAMGAHGAIILGSEQLRDYLINFARSFIYTTALPMHALLSVESAYEQLSQSDAPREKLQQNIAFFRKHILQLPYTILPSHSPIQGVIIPGNAAAKAVARQLEERGYYAKAILSPTVPAGKERLRICLHAFNTMAEMEGLLQCLKESCEQHHI